MPFFIFVFETICKSVFPLQNMFKHRINKHDGWMEYEQGQRSRCQNRALAEQSQRRGQLGLR